MSHGTSLTPPLSPLLDTLIRSETKLAGYLRCMAGNRDSVDQHSVPV